MRIHLGRHREMSTVAMAPSEVFDSMRIRPIEITSQNFRIPPAPPHPHIRKPQTPHRSQSVVDVPSYTSDARLRFTNDPLHLTLTLLFGAHFPFERDIHYLARNERPRHMVVHIEDEYM